MSTEFKVIVNLSDRTAIEFQVFAIGRVQANKEVVKLFGNGKIKSIQSSKI